MKGNEGFSAEERALLLAVKGVGPPSSAGSNSLATIVCRHWPTPTRLISWHWSPACWARPAGRIAPGPRSHRRGHCAGAQPDRP